MKIIFLNLLLFSILLPVFSQVNINALQFDNSDDHIVVSGVNFPDSIGFTYEAWVNPFTNANNEDYIFQIGTDPGTRYFGLRLNGNGYPARLACEFRASSTYYFVACDPGSGEVLAGTGYHHVAATYDGNYLKMYVDGALIKTEPITAVYTFTSNDLKIGAALPTGYYFDGLLDELRMWNYPLDSADIVKFMNCPPDTNSPGLIGYWNFDEGSGTVVRDLSKYNNDGNTINGPTWSSTVPPFNCCTPGVAGFSYIINGNNVSFTDTSFNSTGWQWSFGDSSYSFSRNPGHIYSCSGSYNVCLTISDTCMNNDSICHNIVIYNPPVASFTYVKNDFDVNFTDSSSSANIWWWDFDDGNFSSNQNPSHLYDSAGIYIVCLTITDSCGLQDTICDSLNVYSTVNLFEYSNSGVIIAPNPATDIINIYLQDNNCEGIIKISDMSGRLIDVIYFRERNRVEYNISQLSNGLYIIEIQINNNIYRNKLIRQ